MKGYIKLSNAICHGLLAENEEASVETIKAYDTCERNKREQRAPFGLLQALPTPNVVWTEVSLDFIIGLPNSKAK